MTKPITWRNETRCLGELVPWEHNPRQLKEDQAERLGDSLDQFGQVETVAIEPGDEVVNGHQRLNVLLAQHGKSHEIDVRVASRKLTMDEHKKLTIYLHEGATGDWDFDMLGNIFEVDELVDWGFPEWKLNDMNLPEDWPEYDESIADDVEWLECPECGHKWPK